jgi:hypothetical protein
VQDAIVNTPRFEHATIGGERRPVMRLESARTNINIRSRINTGWSPRGSSSVTPAEIMAPNGKLEGDRYNVSAANDYIVGPIISGDPNGRTFAVAGWVRSVSGTKTLALGVLKDGDVGMFDTTSTAVGPVWTRIHAVGVGTSGTQFAPYLQELGGNTDDFYAWGIQLEEKKSVSSLIETAGASASRAADALSWDFLLPPQPMVIYTRFVERGTVLNGAETSAGLWALTDAASANPRLLMYGKSSGGLRYAAYFHNGTSDTDTVVPAEPGYGDVVETCLSLYSNGAVDVCLSINGAAVVAPATAAAIGLPTSWGGRLLWLNQYSGSNVGSNDFAEIKVVKQADVVGGTQQAVMDELRAFELNAAGEVIS